MRGGALLIDGKGRDLNFGIGELTLPGHTFSIVARAPDFAGREVAINVNALQFREFLAVVNHAAGQ